MGERNDLICFANDWAADPLSKKHIMLRFAKNRRILWINSINNRRPRVAAKDFRRVLQKLRDARAGLTKVEDNIWVLSPLFVPFHRWSVFRKLNRWWLGAQIRRAVRKLKLNNPVTWAFGPTASDVAGHLGEKCIVYHCVDEFGAFSDAASEIPQRERDLLNKAALVIVSSSKLLESKRPHNQNTHLVLHGVDFDHFSRAAVRSAGVAEEIASLQHPILGFHGLIADWVDLKLIAEVARKRPDWSIVLIGRIDTDVSPLSKVGNIHMLGHRPYARLPEYLRGFDVAILPFVSNELTRAANPLKLREYLAAGLPVIAAPLPEIAKFAPPVLLADTADEYITATTALMESGTLGPDPERSEAMKRESWDFKVQELEQHLGSVLA